MSYLPSPAQYTNISTNATTSVKSGPGVLQTICFNTKGASANTLTVYDNTAASGTKIATIDTVNIPGTTLFFGTQGVRFSTGLTIVTATGTAPDITVAWQ